MTVLGLQSAGLEAREGGEGGNPVPKNEEGDLGWTGGSKVPCSELFPPHAQRTFLPFPALHHQVTSPCFLAPSPSQSPLPSGIGEAAVQFQHLG